MYRSAHPRRGALLALLAAALALASAGAAAEGRAPGYLYPQSPLDLSAWLPVAPSEDSLAQAADTQEVFKERALIGTPRAAEAHADDVVKPADKVAPRFVYLAGISVDRRNAPHFLHMMDLVRNDLEWLLAPVKKDVGEGGRPRPFVLYPHLATCEMMTAQLGQSGSYPSGHATTGWLWGSILAELLPEYADQFIARGVAFGDSRVVCGFHFPSDVAAGRIAAAGLLTRLHAAPAFSADLAAARRELRALLAAHAPPAR